MVSRIGIVQLTSTNNLLNNLNKVKSYISKSLSDNLDILVFPEATDFISENKQQSYELAQNVNKDFLSPLQEFIKSLNLNKLHVFIGVHLPSTKSPETKIRNCLLLISNTGEIINNYQKIHTFDVPKVDIIESNLVEKGVELPELQSISDLKIGPNICYDIRFPEQACYLRELGANVLLYPSAFTMLTGKLHWDILGKARSLDTQCYSVLVGQVGQHNEKRASWGHSKIIGPWGDVLLELKETEEDYGFLEININDLEKVRDGMPLFDQKPNNMF
ncbi:related to Probable hydrolase NIT2 [Hanseniaspora guilliermondii]|uniref:Related to Probable hydrolase NIT2 n=1 Tax=Hanseniaspora guilliermondii TaxID=56406 RepID=A0A1L0B8K1_9ASCO|nr:related to Probable hydrolase NIT2 [Hanseniaspora guilliermondii]